MWNRSNEVSSIIKRITIDQALKAKRLRGEMERIGVDPRGIEIMEDKFEHFVVKLYGLTFRQAAIIKQEMLARGADAAVSWQVCSWAQSNSEEEYEVMLGGTLRQLRQLVTKLKQQPFKLAEVAQRLEEALGNYRNNQPKLTIGDAYYDLSERTLIMGIINLTPDSFSKDGLHGGQHAVDAAIEQAQRMIEAGADILDIGAESTRPGGTAVSEEEEAARLFPVLKELVRAVKVPISIDTYKPAIAEKALEIGATIINDIWGLRSPYDPEHRMAKVAGEAKATVVLMHNQSQPEYKWLMSEVIDSISESIEIALKHGVELEKTIIDPGIGFAKNYEDNLKILQNLNELKVLGRPILLGTSRKSVIGLTLNLPVEERLEGTIATVVWGVAQGARIVRVHDVQAVSRAIKMCDAIRKYE